MASFLFILMGEVMSLGRLTDQAFVFQILFGGILLFLVGGLFGGFSFTQKRLRHWSIAGCIVNGLLFFWVLFKCGLLQGRWL